MNGTTYQTICQFIHLKKMCLTFEINRARIIQEYRGSSLLFVKAVEEASRKIRISPGGILGFKRVNVWPSLIMLPCQRRIKEGLLRPK